MPKRVASPEVRTLPPHAGVERMPNARAASSFRHPVGSSNNFLQKTKHALATFRNAFARKSNADTTLAAPGFAVSGSAVSESTVSDFSPESSLNTEEYLEQFNENPDLLDQYKKLEALPEFIDVNGECRSYEVSDLRHHIEKNGTYPLCKPGSDGQLTFAGIRVDLRRLENRPGEPVGNTSAEEGLKEAMALPAPCSGDEVRLPGPGNDKSNADTKVGGPLNSRFEHSNRASESLSGKPDSHIFGGMGRDADVENEPCKHENKACPTCIEMNAPRLAHMGMALPDLHAAADALQSGDESTKEKQASALLFIPSNDNHNREDDKLRGTANLTPHTRPLKKSGHDALKFASAASSPDSSRLTKKEDVAMNSASVNTIDKLNPQQHKVIRKFFKDTLKKLHDAHAQFYLRQSLFGESGEIKKSDLEKHLAIAAEDQAENDLHAQFEHFIGQFGLSATCDFPELDSWRMFDLHGASRFTDYSRVEAFIGKRHPASNENRIEEFIPRANAETTKATLKRLVIEEKKQVYADDARRKAWAMKTCLVRVEGMIKEAIKDRRYEVSCDAAGRLNGVILKPEVSFTESVGSGAQAGRKIVVPLKSAAAFYFRPGVVTDMAGEAVSIRYVNARFDEHRSSVPADSDGLLNEWISDYKKEVDVLLQEILDERASIQLYPNAWGNQARLRKLCTDYYHLLTKHGIHLPASYPFSLPAQDTFLGKVRRVAREIAIRLISYSPESYLESMTRTLRIMGSKLQDCQEFQDAKEIKSRSATLLEWMNGEVQEQAVSPKNRGRFDAIGARLKELNAAPQQFSDHANNGGRKLRKVRSALGWIEKMKDDPAHSIHYKLKYMESCLERVIPNALQVKELKQPYERNWTKARRPVEVMGWERVLAGDGGVFYTMRRFAPNEEFYKPTVNFGFDLASRPVFKA
jgi:hypothetical protein